MRFPRFASVLLLASFVAPGNGAGGEARAVPAAKDRYVVYEQRSDRTGSFDTSRLERRLAFTSRHRYRRAVHGFAASLTPVQAAALRSEPGVAIVPDRPVRAATRTPLATGERVPTGVARIGASLASGLTIGVHNASNAAVAVLDTGIDLGHPDLNAEAGVNCTGSGSPQDSNGHGTHVAGIIGARNSGSGVVGVAPGTKLYAVKVLSSTGTGWVSDIICGVEWVTANAARLGIRVANLSVESLGVGGSCGAEPLHLAICHSSLARVTYVAAAGNGTATGGRDIGPNPYTVAPATFPEVLAVTAMSDSDGAPRATGGAPSCDRGEADDAYASFSNYTTSAQDSAHVVSAPGVCIESTAPGSRYTVSTGTSAAAPHVAGVVALCIGEGASPGPCHDMTAEETIRQVIADADANATPDNGFTGDPRHPLGHYFGFLASAHDPAIRRIPSRPNRPPLEPSSTALSDSAVALRSLRVRSLHGLAVRVILELDEPASVSVRGKVGFARRRGSGRATRAVRLRAASGRAAAGKRLRLRLALRPRAMRRVRAALRDGRRPRARLVVQLHDSPGNTLLKRRSVRLRR